ncbi:hypoxia-inducible factor 1-alpha-like isoform X2 [Mercenaria mercenaria]|uniref:hypoxia-inducible factor 1-alpha-like isoform X2 n=1 Tax=Mercenaria mercenaria TaxID=6596 RepID=UPI001E1DACD3|nr:hypoxia-inducible factor 1-alpha-like isoform X2 [Mercenaria mercenaria]
MERERILGYTTLSYRNSEKRKEKSRDAARSRRGKEAEIFSELAGQLPMLPATIDALDKASVMRLLLSTLKIKTVMEKRPKLEQPDEDSEDAAVDSLYPKALDGFLLVLSKEGDVIYTSESVSKFLGLQQIDLMGQSLYEFAHPCDHEEIQDVLAPHGKGDERTAARTIFIRLKCTLTSKGRSVNLKSAVYKVFKLTGKYVPDDTEVPEDNENDITMKEEDEEEYDSDDSDRVRPYRPQPLPHFLAIGEAIHHPSNIEVPLDKRTFISRHSMNMKFTDCDERIKRLIGYQNDEMVGQSFYAFPHAIDSKMMEKAFKDLFSKGQTATGQYRFLAKNGGYVWMVTEATVIFNSRSQKPECVVCVHYVLSHVEQHGRVLSDVQLPSAAVVKEEQATPPPCDVLKATTSSSSPRVSKTTPRCSRRRDVKLEDMFPVPTFSTETVFGEKTDDMEQDFYFPQGVKKTLDHSDELNLSHLAPQDGDVCIPLSVPIYDDVKKVKDFSQISLYDDVPRKKEVPLSRFEERRGDPRMVSPSRSTPEGTLSPADSPASYLTTINPKDISAMDDLFTTLDPSMENGQEIDFTLRAPFIPMTSDEDFVLSQPSTDSLLNMGADFNPGIFGCTESVFHLRDELYDGPTTEKKSKTAYEIIGDNTVKKSIEGPRDQMMMKMKRRLDRSNLEKGPPVKMTKYQLPVGFGNSLHVGIPQENSVLMNLLLKGEDVAHGYSVRKKDNIISKKRADTTGFLQNLLTSVSSHDVDVNAPAHSSRLLQGQDIMTALSMNKKQFC